jgi:hypothetical protein
VFYKYDKDGYWSRQTNCSQNATIKICLCISGHIADKHCFYNGNMPTENSQEMLYLALFYQQIDLCLASYMTIAYSTVHPPMAVVKISYHAFTFSFQIPSNLLFHSSSSWWIPYCPVLLPLGIYNKKEHQPQEQRIVAANLQYTKIYTIIRWW